MLILAYIFGLPGYSFAAIVALLPSCVRHESGQAKTLGERLRGRVVDVVAVERDHATLLQVECSGQYRLSPQATAPVLRPGIDVSLGPDCVLTRRKAGGSDVPIYEDGVSGGRFEIHLQIGLVNTGTPGFCQAERFGRNL